MLKNKPIIIKGYEYLKLILGNANKSIKRVATKGYIAILWYQQRIQGGNSITMEKNKLPSIAIKADNQARKRKYQETDINF